MRWKDHLRNSYRTRRVWCPRIGGVVMFKDTTVEPGSGLRMRRGDEDTLKNSLIELDELMFENKPNMNVDVNKGDRQVSVFDTDDLTIWGQ